MRKLGLALCLLVGLAPAHAQTVQPGTANNPAGAYNTVPPTCTASGFCLFQVDVNGNLKITGSVTPTAPVGSASIATSQASITTGNISAAAARAGRQAITITNVTGTGPVYCGVTGVSTSTGTYIGATAGSNITLNTSAAVFCTVASTTQTVTVAETF